MIICNRMVVDYPASPAAVDRLFHALAHPARRDMVARALDGEYSVSALARCYPMSVTAVQKHVAVLEHAGLVTRTRRGREQLVKADLGALASARAALDALEDVWRQRVDRMGDVLTATREGDPR